MAEPTFLQTISQEYILMPNIKGKDKPFGIGKKWSLEEAQHKTNKRQIYLLLLLFKRH